MSSLQIKWKLASPKFRPLWTERKRYRHFVFHGGRGGAKDYSIAIFILDMMLHYRTRVLILREVMNSILESNHQIFVDLITEYGLNEHFELTEREIRCPRTQSQIWFKGCLNPESLKSIQGVDITFFNEAQTVSQKTLDYVLPTVMRKPGSIVIFALNPLFPSDPVYAEYITDQREDTLAVPVGLHDNRFAPAALVAQANSLQQRDPDKYEWVYGGKCLGETTLSLIKMIEVLEARRRIPVRDENLPISAGLDPSGLGQDKTVLVRVRGTEVLSTHTHPGGSVQEVTNWCKDIYMSHNFDSITIDASGSTGVYDLVKQWSQGAVDGPEVYRFLGGESAQRQELHNNKRTESWCWLRDWLREGGSLPNKDDWNELAMVQWQPDGVGERIKLLPKHKLAHSPDFGDALAMALYYRKGIAKKHKQKNTVAPNKQFIQRSSGKGWAG